MAGASFQEFVGAHELPLYKALVKAKSEPGLWMEYVPVPEVGPGDDGRRRLLGCGVRRFITALRRRRFIARGGEPSGALKCARESGDEVTAVQRVRLLAEQVGLGGVVALLTGWHPGWLEGSQRRGHREDPPVGGPSCRGGPFPRDGSFPFSGAPSGRGA